MHKLRAGIAAREICCVLAKPRHRNAVARANDVAEAERGQYDFGRPQNLRQDVLCNRLIVPVIHGGIAFSGRKFFFYVICSLYQDGIVCRDTAGIDNLLSTAFDRGLSQVPGAS